VTKSISIATAAALLLSASVIVFGQGGQAPATPPQPAKTAAPIDLTGTWVSIVTEDWRWRMVTPAKGDYVTIPINAEGKKVADAWDPAKDEAAGEQCKSYAGDHARTRPCAHHVAGRQHLEGRD
jgi:hypothetical protein